MAATHDERGGAAAPPLLPDRAEPDLVAVAKASLADPANLPLLIGGAACLALFAWLLALHPTASGRTYAAYGGVYVGVAILWLWWVDAVKPTRWDLLGVSLCLAGMAVIMFAPRAA